MASIWAMILPHPAMISPYSCSRTALKVAIRSGPPSTASVRSTSAGDAMARLRVRWEEVDQSFGLLRSAAAELAERTGDQLRARCEPSAGRALGWAEAPQGEVLYDVSLAGGRIARCHPRSASFHNLVLMHEVFCGDILTDFPFIEASFGLSVAGVAL
jgi:formate hydrogenlyase subunit 5